jgi:CCR4-NOT transcription complex subunit 1
VGGNRPILAKELDIKQLLVEGFTSKKLKLVVTFVCRILKECSKSSIFKHHNPWIKANLEILREIYDYGLNQNLINQAGEIQMEIDTLFRSLGLSLTEINHSGFLKASQTQEF